MRLTKRKLIYSFIVILIFFFLFTFNLPYYIYKPGQTDSLENMVEIKGGREGKGDLHLVTVSGGQATPIQYTLAKFLAFNEIVPIEDARPEGISDEEYMEHQLKLMENSQHSSTVVAYRAAGADYSIEQNGIYVVSVIDGMPAKERVKPGDRILKVDGKVIKEANDLVTYVKDKKVGDEIEIVIEREGEKMTEAVEVAEFSDENKVGIGIQLVTDQKIIVDPPVDIKSGNIGGPSAGLMFALEMYNQLTEEDVTKGYHIAGTGEIDFDGNIHRIGGIDKKIVAADRHGIEIFFAPHENGAEGSNYQVALETAKEIETSMEIVPVDTFDDALMYLERLDPK